MLTLAVLLLHIGGAGSLVPELFAYQFWSGSRGRREIQTGRFISEFGAEMLVFLAPLLPY